MKINDAVWALDSTAASRAYLVRPAGAGATLIDTCTPSARRAADIIGELEGLGVGALEAILITHHDLDHIGNMAALQRHFGCPVYINPLELPYIYGEKRRSGTKALLGLVSHADTSARLTNVAEYPPGAIRPLHMPGHTPGHMCYLFENCLFSGDLVRHVRGKTVPSRRRMNWNTKALLASMQKLETLDFAYFCSAHYGCWRRDDDKTAGD